MPVATRKGMLRPDLPGAFRLYPVPVLAAALLTGWFASDGNLYSAVSPISALLLGFFAATGAGFAAAKRPLWLSWTGQALAFLLAVAVGRWMDSAPRAVIPALAALICAVSLAGGLAAGHGVTGYWLANARLAANLAVCITVAGIVTAGGAIVLASIRILLGLPMGEIEDHLAMLLWIFALPVAWLSLARFDDVHPGELQGNVLLRILALVTDALLIPIMLVFAAVIHLYAARIAILAELPKGQIGWIVPTYLATGYSVFLLAQGPDMQFPRLRHTFCRLFLAGTLVPLLLLALALKVRIDAYGITEGRYMLVLTVIGGVLLAASAAVRRPFDIRLVPAAIAALACVAVIGPLSAKNMTIRSQTERARAILASVPQERWVSAKDGGLSERQKIELISAVGHLEERTPDLSALDPVWPPHLPRRSWQVRDALVRQQKTFASGQVGIMRLQKATYIERFSLHWKDGSTTVSNGSLEYVVLAQGNWLEVSGEGTVARFDLARLFEIEKSDATTVGRKLLLQSRDGRQGDLIVSQFMRSEGPEGKSLEYVWGTIILY